MSKEKGLLVSVYRDSKGYDCTLDGISSKHDSFVLTGVDCKVFEAHESLPALKIVRREIFGSTYLHAEPLEHPKNTVGAMFGGNFIYTSDARFPSRQPIAIHDRYETPEQYKHFST